MDRQFRARGEEEAGRDGAGRTMVPEILQSAWSVADLWIPRLSVVSDAGGKGY